MKKVLKPAWSKQQAAAAARSFAQWDAFFAARQTAAAAESAPAARVAAVRARHEAKLLRFPNVVAVAEGLRTRGGAPTAEPCIVVYVARKLPAKALAPAARLPKRVEGVPIDVVEAGPISTLPA